MVDPGRIRRLLEILARFREHLTVLRDMTLDEYLEERAFEGRYLVQASAQICIDIANHVISSEGWRTPQDFRDAFTVLEEQDVLDGELQPASALSPASGTASSTCTTTWTTPACTRHSARASKISMASPGTSPVSSRRSRSPRFSPRAQGQSVAPGWTQACIFDPSWLRMGAPGETPI